MFTDSLFSGLRTPRDGRPAGAAEDSCRFWTPAEGGLCVQHVRVPQSVLYRPHSHSEYGIVVCLEGEVLKEQLGGRAVAGPGEVVMSNSGIEHASGYLAGPRGGEAVCLTIERRTLGALLPEFGLPDLTPEAGPIFHAKLASQALLDCARQIARELAAREPGCGLVIEGLACRILVETLRAWPRAQIEKGPIDPTPRLSRHDFIRAYEFMRWCRKDNFRLQHLCQIIGSSEERFTRLFLAAVRATPAQFYNQMLMERGCEWLRDPRVPVKTVGIELGFKTTSHFIACFRRHFAMTPQDYRRRHAGLM